jgi:hypothetical protein
LDHEIGRGVWKQADSFKPVGKKVLEEQGNLIQQFQGRINKLEVVHPVLARVDQMWGKGLVHSNMEVWNCWIKFSRVLEVTEVKPEIVLHACKQCSTKTKRVMRLDVDIEGRTPSFIR